MTLALHVNLDTAVSMLAQAVHAKGRDHTVTHCQYLASSYDHDTDVRTLLPEGMCIVGTAIFLRVGPEAALRVFAECNFQGLYTARARLLVEGITLDQDAFMVWRNAQETQDKGRTWGRAFDVALKTAFTPDYNFYDDKDEH